ncbi:hypothetical protein BAUCODRAFT_574146 [Baudoinia panamericana UAMH 10762]|uniref:Uncharacterized protein n=1 Tax=Baudoinia panamericana (strain UAMH 10762) TaxID=717646 RepID=M2NFQ0_BAUPA|nr:uncharacterized protein BAUCODRAFT_574146 [Baudoinia panamericana UAMH 10762]EMC98079.1 hypothetical protein BAUCODRAFT_574146 [Baudoinia panamericana UAMH 10762]
MFGYAVEDQLDTLLGEADNRALGLADVTIAVLVWADFEHFRERYRELEQDLHDEGAFDTFCGSVEIHQTAAVQRNQHIRLRSEQARRAWRRFQSAYELWKTVTTKDSIKRDSGQRTVSSRLPKSAQMDMGTEITMPAGGCVWCMTIGVCAESSAERQRLGRWPKNVYFGPTGAMNLPASVTCVRLKFSQSMKYLHVEVRKPSYSSHALLDFPGLLSGNAASIAPSAQYPTSPARLLNWVALMCGLGRSANRPGKKLHKGAPVERRSVTARQPDIPSASPPQASQDAQALSRRGSTASTLFRLPPMLKDFAYEIELRLLTPLEKAIHRELSRVAGSGSLRVITQPGSEVLELSDQNSADACTAVQGLTKNLRERDREMACRDLDKLVTHAQQLVLRRLLFHKLEVRCGSQQAGVRTVEADSIGPGTVRRPDPGPYPRLYNPRRASLAGADAEAAGPQRWLSPYELRCTSPVNRGIRVQRSFALYEEPYLRGGGDEVDESSQAKVRIWDVVRKPRRLNDQERPPALLWWFAGGRLKRKRPGLAVPTAAELRDRREVAKLNRERVGFWGNVAGAREVSMTRKELAAMRGSEVAESYQTHQTTWPPRSGLHSDPPQHKRGGAKHPQPEDLVSSESHDEEPASPLTHGLPSDEITAQPHKRMPGVQSEEETSG